MNFFVYALAMGHEALASTLSSKLSVLGFLMVVSCGICLPVVAAVEGPGHFRNHTTGDAPDLQQVQTKVAPFAKELEALLDAKEAGEQVDEQRLAELQSKLADALQ